MFISRNVKFDDVMISRAFDTAIFSLTKEDRQDIGEIVSNDKTGKGRRTKLS